jgi:hypothetical protein
MWLDMALVVIRMLAIGVPLCLVTSSLSLVQRPSKVTWLIMTVPPWVR